MRRYLGLLLCAILPLALWRSGYLLPASKPSQWLDSFYPDRSAEANATLGFQVILAVSAEDPNSPHAWRQSGLIKAANRTGLSIDIPKLEPATNVELSNITQQNVVNDGEKPHWPPSEGQARAWLAHRKLIQKAIDLNVTTALIIEDDSDWDIHLPTIIKSIASEIRNITSSSLPPSLFPYGLSWDILYIGHCGFTDNSPPYTVAGQLTTYHDFPDPHVPTLNNIKSVFDPNPYPLGYGPANGTRRVQYTHGALCTFGYALTRDGARKALKLSMRAESEAWDVRLRKGCGDGDVECLAVVPEVIHHQRVIGDVNALSAPTTDAEAGKDKGGGKGGNVGIEKRRVFTFNILDSARCNWDRWQEGELVQCVPTPEEFEKYKT